MATISRRRRPVRKVRKKRRKPRRRPVAVKRPPVVSKPAPVTPTPRPTPTPTPAPTPTPSPTPPQPLTPSGEYAVVATPAMAATLRATAAERLFLNRFGTGFSQRALQQLRTVGTPQEWLGAQLRPTGFQEHPKVATVDAWFASLRTDSPATRWSNQVNNRKGGWVYGHELGNWAILRRIYSERTVLERMTDFWATNLHVPQSHDRAWIWRFDYDRVLREHALGRFEDLLREASLHPAMRLYLDNYRSRKGSPNENQGRELLELHSVGVGAGYTEQMVKDSAKILSGWTVAWDTSKGNFAPFYDPRAHTTGAVSVLGFQHANAADDGQQVTLDYLRHLAHHPATARNLARKLALYLVSDDPSQALVEALAQAYLEADTSIAAMLTRLASHPEFLASTGRKVRTPIDDLVATARVLQVEVTKAHTNADGDDSYARHANWTHASQQAFSWPRPDGPPVRGSAWATPSRMFGSYSMHWNHAGGYWPKGATYAAAASWLPKASLSLDEMTEHLCQRWLGRASDARLRQTVRQALTDPGASPMSASTVVSTDSPVIRWMFVRLTAALLDSPDHMTT